GPVQRDRRWVGYRPRNGTYPARDRSGARAGVHVLPSGQRRRAQPDGIRRRLLRRLATPAGHRGAQLAATIPLSALGAAPLHGGRDTGESSTGGAVTSLTPSRRARHCPAPVVGPPHRPAPAPPRHPALPGSSSTPSARSPGSCPPSASRSSVPAWKLAAPHACWVWHRPSLR